MVDFTNSGIMCFNGFLLYFSISLYCMCLCELGTGFAIRGVSTRYVGKRENLTRSL